ncbi:phosphoinositide 3-kinase regulatory subunit 5 [Alligator mississippiensis]|uniref:Phosphoinositide 3-kinase regulatory subunit 5 n=1 Tax=Alligator mississippiensis TaxID=8496 RepID=A0A151NVA6_ALLMI|nr:phosphoinositide 3-kinase regulatory subunit 5 [Alligator mississippiensis]XP_019341262.1 phosphoinositide 3-kinase regulatory subunit 5 [Alligator mississippiensis]KYO40807.1 phosphoinositide 3-kinase regulatory subunit 5 [Alligator mississippiensis]
MQHTTCTEDRIHHALERCLHGLSRSAVSSTTWTAGLCLNCWSLQELVSRDAGNYLILLEKILQKTKEVQDDCDYDLLTPLALLFYSAVLCTPHFPSDSDLLRKAISIYHNFLTWPVPYCDIFRELLTFISDELKAPGISYQRLVRTEQGLFVKNYQSSTITVLLLNPSEIQSDFLSIAEKLSGTEQQQHSTVVTLIEHVYQANFGNQYDLSSLCQVLKSKTLEVLLEIYSSITEAQELAAVTSDPATAREQLKSTLQDIGTRAGFPKITAAAQSYKPHTIPIPVARCYAYSWDKDNFDILNEVLVKECDIAKPVVLENEEEEEEEEEVEIDGCFPERDSLLSPISAVSKESVYSALSEDMSKHSRISLFTTSKDSLSELSLVSKKTFKSFVSSLKDCMDSGYAEDSDESSLEVLGRLELREKTLHKQRQSLTNKIYKLFKSRSQLVLRKDLKDYPDIGSLTLPLRRAESLGNPEAKHRIPARSRRAHSLPQHVLRLRLPQQHATQKVCIQRRPFLSYDEDTKVSTLRVVVFGSDRISGKVARAYSNLRLQESNCPLLTRYFKLQFFYIPVKRSSFTSSAPLTHPPSPGEPPLRASAQMVEPFLAGMESSTTDISNYIGMLDPWYERNVLGLMNLPTDVLGQQSAKPEMEPQKDSREQLPILADMILYYCRFATRPVLLQLYQTELTLMGGQKITEVFIHSLELGHSAATRAIKASGPGSKRLGIDGDREAIPLTLRIAYSKTASSGRNRWNNVEKVCTSVNLRKACKKYEELDSKMECLDLTITEVVKRQNSKSKKSFNQQISVSQIKVDKVQITGINCSFAVCLDQDERKILQSVTRCEVSACYKPRDNEPSGTRRSSSFHLSQDPSEFCSLLCLPIATFSGALP